MISMLSIMLFSCSESIPGFDGDRAFGYLEDQCQFGPRNPGSDGIQLCRDYIIDKLSALGAIIEIQSFSAEIGTEEYEGVNIIASFYPRLSRRILLGAHYDTRPWADKESDPDLHNTPIPGANDAASGVAVLLELAAILNQFEPPQYGIDLVFFDLEDMGNYGDNETWCLGSQYFAGNYRGNLPEKAIVVDMIGDADLLIEMEYLSYHNAPALVNEVWNIARQLGFKQFKQRISNRIYDDHVPLIKAGFEAILIIDFDYPYWHTLQDTPDKCSPQSLQVVGQTLLHLIYATN